MQNRLRRLLVSLIGIILLLALSLPGSPDQVAAQNASPASGSGPQVVWATGPSLSEPLRSIQPAASVQPQGETKLNPQTDSPGLTFQAFPLTTASIHPFCSPTRSALPCPLPFPSFDGVSLDICLPTRKAPSATTRREVKSTTWNG